MKIGLQNFQGIGAYTEIPIAPITLFYGPNSAGKSTVADAFQFLSSTLSGKNKNWKEDLGKHARRNREERLLSDGFIGTPCDVVFKVVVIIGDEVQAMTMNSDLLEFCARDGFQNAVGWLSTYEGIQQVFANGKEFEYLIIFDQGKETHEWRLRELLLTIDEHPLFRIQNDDASGSNNSVLAFNIRHPAYKKPLKKLDGLIRWWFFNDDYDAVSRSEEIADKYNCWRTFGDNQKLPLLTGSAAIFTGLLAIDPFSLSPITWGSMSIASGDALDHDEGRAKFHILNEYLSFGSSRKSVGKNGHESA